MKGIAGICKSSKQRGNALVLLILLKTWDGKEAPDLYELADLANISPRQAERDLQKLIAEGTAERAPDTVKGRGHVTRFRLKESTTHVSDKTASDVTGILETTTHLTDLSDSKCVTSDADTERKYDTSDGTPLAPSKAKELLSTTGAKAPSPRARGQASEIELPEWLPVESWHEWEEHRREIKKPLTALSVKKQLKLLADYRARGMPPVQVIEHAIAHGWRNLYALNEVENGNGHGREKQARGRDDASRRSAPQDRKPPGQWRFKNSAGG
jgi:hypothetical protein